jgi:hypothetical protein
MTTPHLDFAPRKEDQPCEPAKWMLPTALTEKSTPVSAEQGRLL